MTGYDTGITFAHQGPPEPDKDSYDGWDATGACLLAYAMPLKSVGLTGKRPSKVPQLDAAAAEQLILTGRGWNNKDRYSFYDTVPRVSFPSLSASPLTSLPASLIFPRTSASKNPSPSARPSAKSKPQPTTKS